MSLARNTVERKIVSIDQYRTDQVFVIIQELTSQGLDEFRPGHIADALREAGDPLLTWEIRGELSTLEADGLISVNAATGAYHLAEAARKAG